MNISSNLKGSFLFIFYFLLNDEVKKHLRDQKKKKRLKLKEKHVHLANLHDLIARNMNNLGEDDDDDDDEDEDGDDDDDEEEVQEEKIKNKSSNLRRNGKKEKTNSPTILNNNLNLSQPENSDVFLNSFSSNKGMVIKF